VGAQGEETARGRLLAAVLDHLTTYGMQDTTLRGLAAAVGTSHRMLRYHFGSREQLLVEISRAVEQQQRGALERLLANDELSAREVMRDMWRRLADPSLAPHERLFFEVYARSLRADGGADGFLPEVIEAWLPPLARLFERLGFAPPAALAEARLALALTRGMLLDLLATGDRAAAEAVMERYLARLWP
jgi:AcrR family transcriptional regulator